MKNKVIKILKNYYTWLAGLCLAIGMPIAYEINQQIIQFLDRFEDRDA